MPRGAPDFWRVTIQGMPIIGGGQEAWYMSESVEVAANSSEDLVNYVVPDNYELHIGSGLVSTNFPHLTRYDLRTTPAASWVSPISHIDASGDWYYEENAYDGNIATVAIGVIEEAGWGQYLELVINQVMINKIRFYAYIDIPGADEIDIDVYYGGAWHDVYEGAFAWREWVVKDIPAGVQLISSARVRLNIGVYQDVSFYLYEFQFNTSGVTPQEGVYFDTHAIIPFTSQAPYLVPAGATFAVRVYNDDDAAHIMAVSLAGFLQAKV